jgi:hypothetical protein
MSDIVNFKSNIVNVMSTKDLPKLYAMFQDDEKYARRRIEQIRDKLSARGRIVVDPLRIYRYTYKSGWSLLAIELMDKEVAPLKGKSEKNLVKIEKRIRGRK